MKSGFCITTGDNQLSSWTEKKLQSISQSQTCTKKRSWSLFGGLIHYSFPNPSKTITSEKYAQQIDEMHWKLQCLQPALVNRKGTIFLHDNTPQCMAQPMLQMLNELGYNGLPYLLYLTDISPTDYHLVKHLDNCFPGKVCLQLAGWRKCFPRVRWIPKHGFLCYRNKQAYSLWQKWF